MKERLKLKSVNICGFKSIDSKGQDISFGDVTVFIGANGAGKSNIVSYFKMLRSFTQSEFQKYIVKSGSVSSILHYGQKFTNAISSTLNFSTNEEYEFKYNFELSYVVGDKLTFNEEKLIGLGHGVDREDGYNNISPFESALPKMISYTFFVELIELLYRINIYQFNDTSDTALIKSQCYLYDNINLRSDGGNLAAYLYLLIKNPETIRYYNRIVNHIRTIMPQFKDFIIKPLVDDPTSIKLNWKEQGKSDYVFGPHQLSDGTLRFIALATLLLQPPKDLPKIIVLDEPELGLHPAAITALAGMIKTASANCQVIVATQSASLLDEFSANEIVVVERDEKTQSSVFKRLDEPALEDWLKRYSISELWEKNVLGGRP